MKRKNNIINFIRENLKLSENDVNLRRIRFMYIFTVVSQIFFIGFGIVNLFTGNYISASVEIIIGLVFVLNAFVYHYSKNQKLAYSTILILLFAFFLYMISDGGLASSGLYWMFISPVVAFFLLGKKSGLYWSFYLIIFLLLCIVLQHINLISLAFEPATIMMAIAALIMETIFVYIYEYINEYISEYVHDKQRDLQEINANLKKEIISKKRTEKKLQNKLEESEKLNQLMVGRELKINELKKQIRKK